MKAANYIPEGRHTVTPFLVVRGADKAIDFYVKAFGAQEIVRMVAPDGKSIMHSQIKIGDSTICITDESPQCNTKSPESLGGVASTLFLYVKDVDAAFKQAVAAGCESKMEPADMFWGDRFSSVQDPFGHQWSLATHVELLTGDEIKKRQD
ncbi:MAG: VOC family protein, partial [Candidatus Obscuribacterales bacterium]|nr:VOC family protein [Candidatus Obscuribacterales bacterium]